jgi:hypothetical protein
MLSGIAVSNTSVAPIRTVHRSVDPPTVKVLGRLDVSCTMALPTRPYTDTGDGVLSSTDRPQPRVNHREATPRRSGCE